MPVSWDDLLLTYLHDPPSKALKIQGHESRAAGLASIALGRSVTAQELHRDSRTGDQFAALVERLPLPNAGADYERAVGPVGGRLTVGHPLSGERESLPVGQLDTAAEEGVMRELIAGIDPMRARFLAVWRCFRDRLARRDATRARLPAETRAPDHTVWSHLDAAAMLHEPHRDGGGPALLTFGLGPVQAFIASARSLRDLWTGSYLLAWLTFAAMKPVLEACGPTAFVYPSLRGNPLVDRWLREIEPALAGHVPQPDPQDLLTPCLPNRFVAVVPFGPDGATADRFVKECERECRSAWKGVAEAVRGRLRRPVRELSHSDRWDREWDRQIDSFFEIRLAALPLRQCMDARISALLATDGRFETAFPEAAEVRKLARAIPAPDRYGFDQEHAGRWQGQMAAAAGLLGAMKAVRHVPDYTPEGDVSGKCSLLGTYEQMGPARLQDSMAFWEEFAERVRIDGTRVRTGERLCAVSLVKRFAWPAFFSPTLRVPATELRYPDTASVAAEEWLRDGQALDRAKLRDEEGRWNGQWLHWTSPRQDTAEKPCPPDVWKTIVAKRTAQGPAPAYYAVLMLDGDDLGKWLRGELLPKLGTVYADRILAYFRSLQSPDVARALDARRPLGPGIHAALSEALTNFALHFVPAIVEHEDHRGTLVYAGGDDVLALLPNRRAIACARALREAYRKEYATGKDGVERLLMGRAATVSAGLVVAHYKEDLRLVLEQARAAERQAKLAGRDALALRICRRSGEHSSAVVPWDQSEALGELVDRFVDGLSDRWAYKLRAEMPTLRGQPWEMIDAELRRLLDRVEAGKSDDLIEAVTGFFRDYREAVTAAPRAKTGPDALEGFVTLCQSASFLARGRDA